MTDYTELQSLKTIAKRLARATRIRHHFALDHIAGWLDYPHWNALTVAWGKGWRPTLSQAAKLDNALSANRNPLSSDELRQVEGSIDGHVYSICMDLTEVLVQGRGWAISLGHAPSQKPMIEVTDRRLKKNPIHDPEFSLKALAIARSAAKHLRMHTAASWSRRSTRPDAEGRVRHPLFSDVASEWHCLHCDGSFAGAEIALNMWHCPKCNATPIDMFARPFWKGIS